MCSSRFKLLGTFLDLLKPTAIPVLVSAPPASNCTMAHTLTLNEDTLDDILYFARANETDDLLSLLSALADTNKTSPMIVLSSAIDKESGSTAIHYAAANGHSELLRKIFALGGSSETRRCLARVKNKSKNTALHYASMNGQLDAAQVVAAANLPAFVAPEPVDSDEKIHSMDGANDESTVSASVPGAKHDTRDLEMSLSQAARDAQVEFLEVKNVVGRDAAAEAEAAGHDAVVGWLLGVLDRLDPDAAEESSAANPRDDDLSAQDVVDEVDSIKINA